MLIKLIVAVFMEKQTKKNANNSSIPPSQSEEDESTVDDSDNKKQRQQREKSNTHQSAHTRTVETVTISEVATCQHCGESLCDEACIGMERRTLIDSVFEKQVNHVDAEIKACPNAMCIFRFIRPLIPVLSAHPFHSYSPGHSSVIRQSLSHTL